MLRKDATIGARVTWGGRAATIMAEPEMNVRPDEYAKLRVWVRFDDNHGERLVSVASLLKERQPPTEEDVQRLRGEWQFACRNGHSEAMRNARFKAYRDTADALDATYAVKGIMACPRCSAVGQPQPSHNDEGERGFRCLSCGEQSPTDDWLNPL
jgi:hypothetical protein